MNFAHWQLVSVFLQHAPIFSTPAGDSSAVQRWANVPVGSQPRCGNRRVLGHLLPRWQQFSWYACFWLPIWHHPYHFVLQSALVMIPSALPSTIASWSGPTNCTGRLSSTMTNASEIDDDLFFKARKMSDRRCVSCKLAWSLAGFK